MSRTAACWLMLSLALPCAAGAQGLPTPDYCGRQPRMPPWTAIELLPDTEPAREGIVLIGSNEGQPELAWPALDIVVTDAAGALVEGKPELWGLPGRKQMLVAFRPTKVFDAGGAYRVRVTTHNARLTSCPTTKDLDVSFDVRVAGALLPALEEPALSGVQWVEAWTTRFESCCPVRDPALCGARCEMCWNWLRAPGLRALFSETPPIGPDLLHALRVGHINAAGRLVSEGGYGLLREPAFEEPALVAGDSPERCVVAEIWRFRDNARASRMLCVPDLTRDPNANVMTQPPPAAATNSSGTLFPLSTCAVIPEPNRWSDIRVESAYVWASFRQAPERPVAAAGTAAPSSLGAAGAQAMQPTAAERSMQAPGGCALSDTRRAHGKPRWHIAWSSLIALWLTSRRIRTRAAVHAKHRVGTHLPN